MTVPIHEAGRTLTLSEAERERYEAKVDRTGDCHLWTAATDRDGYGWFKLRGRMTYAHRLALVIAGVDLPDDRMACHRCDNPPCVNADHLFVGTAASNSADMIAKGRHVHGDDHWTKTRPARGEDNPAHRLTESDVIAIRAEYATKGTRQVDLAHRYGVSQVAISHAIRGRSWGHIDVKVPA